MNTINKKIEEHYDRTQIFYNLFWFDNKGLGMHYGFWDDGIKNLHDAVVNENMVLAKEAKVVKEDMILDAGCGVGGSCIWLAKNYGVKITGITLSEKQAGLAKKYAKAENVENLTNFIVDDFCKTKFADSTFTKIFAVESMCHAEEKRDFIEESFRLLKKGGKLIVADYFVKEELNAKEAELIDGWCYGWEMRNLATIANFKKKLELAGFTNIKYIDKTKEIMPSSLRMFISIGIIVRSCLKILEFLKIRPSHGGTKAVFNQYFIFKKSIASYCIFLAEK